MAESKVQSTTMKIFLFHLSPGYYELRGQEFFEDCVLAGQQNENWKNVRLPVSVTDIPLDSDPFLAADDDDDDDEDEREVITKLQLVKVATALRGIYKEAKKAHWTAISIAWSDFAKQKVANKLPTRPLASLLADYVQERVDLEKMVDGLWAEQETNFLGIFFQCLDEFLFPGCGDDAHIVVLSQVVSLDQKDARNHFYVDDSTDAIKKRQLNLQALARYFAGGFVDAHPAVRSGRIGALPRKPIPGKPGKTEPVLPTELRKKVSSLVTGGGFSPDALCDLCQDKKAKFYCSACKINVYCSQECQAGDWEDHQHLCFDV